jgi:hypothetical protein
LVPVGFGLRIDKFFVAVAGQQVAIQGFVVGSNAVFGNIVKVLQVIVVGLLVKRFMEFVINFLQNLGIFDSGIFILLFNIFIRILSCSREGGTSKKHPLFPQL